MTSAPRSPRNMVQKGPARTRERSRTRTPSRGPVPGLGKMGGDSIPPSLSEAIVRSLSVPERGAVDDQESERLGPQAHHLVVQPGRDEDDGLWPADFRRTVSQGDPGASSQHVDGLGLGRVAVALGDSARVQDPEDELEPAGEAPLHET